MERRPFAAVRFLGPRYEKRRSTDSYRSYFSPIIIEKLWENFPSISNSPVRDEFQMHGGKNRRIYGLRGARF